MNNQEIAPVAASPDRFQEISYNLAATNPNNPPWNSLVAFLVWAASVVLILLVPGVFLIPYLLVKAREFPDNALLVEFASSDPISIALQIGAILPAHLITLAVCWLVVTNFRKYPFLTTLGWKSGGMRWWHYIVILAGFFAVAAVVGYFLPEQENEMLRILKSSRFALFAVAFLATFTAPLVEEIIYRGILYSAFQKTAGTWAAVAIVTVFFSLVHLPQYYPSISTMILLTLLSLILTLVRVQTNNLLPCVILHTVFNASQCLLLIAEPPA